MCWDSDRRNGCECIAVSVGVANGHHAEIRYGIEKAIVHKLKGKQSNHHIDTEVKTKAVEIIKNAYADFKAILAAEKLEELHGIMITAQTARIWMTEAGIWKPRRIR